VYVVGLGLGLGFCDTWWDNRAELTVKWGRFIAKVLAVFRSPTSMGLGFRHVRTAPFDCHDMNCMYFVELIRETFY
jgi:hypothetical protein